MLALSLLRYWWLRPQVTDPLRVEDHDTLRSKSLSSFLEPFSGPQLSRTQLWTKIPHFYGGIDPMQRSVIEIEKAVAEGKDMILVEPEIAGQVYLNYVSHGWLLQENTIFYGLLGLGISYFLPKLWYIYTPCSLLSLMHSWVYFRVYKYDRLSEYQAYDDDRHPVSSLITAWVLGQRPDHYQYVLKKEKGITWEIVSEIIMYSSLICTLFRLMQIEEHVVGGKFVPSIHSPMPLTDALSTPAYQSGYFQAIELIPVSPGSYLPEDIPKVTGWFDLPWFNFRLKPMKADLAIIICAMGGYFVYKAFDHLLGASEDEADELGREWPTNEVAVNRSAKEVHPYWMELEEEKDMLGTGTQKGDSITEEQKEITRIASEVPYGWVPIGYSENHYGVFT